MKTYVFLSIVEQEIQKAVDYYESCSTGLGKQFAQEIQKSLCYITQYPHAWTLVRKDIRRYIINRFPYAILYYIDQDKIVVVAVMNSRQQPDYWISRS